MRARVRVRAGLGAGGVVTRWGNGRSGPSRGGVARGEDRGAARTGVSARAGIRGSPPPAARRGAPSERGPNGTAEGTRSPWGCLVTSWTRLSSEPPLAPRLRGLGCTELSLPLFPASPPEQKAGVSLRRGQSQEELGRSKDEPAHCWTGDGFGDTEASPPNEEVSPGGVK